MRPFDGRHRYLDDPNWPREFYYCGNFDEFCRVRGNLDIKKNPNPNEWKKFLKDYGDYLREVNNVPVEELAITMYTSLDVYPLKVLRNVPEEWRNSQKAENRGGKRTKKIQSQKMDQQEAGHVIVTNATKEQEIQTLRETIDSNNKEIEVLNETIRTKNETIETLKKDIDYLSEYIKKTFRDKGM